MPKESLARSSFESKLIFSMPPESRGAQAPRPFQRNLRDFLPPRMVIPVRLDDLQWLAAGLKILSPSPNGHVTRHMRPYSGHYRLPYSLNSEW